MNVFPGKTRPLFPHRHQRRVTCHLRVATLPLHVCDGENRSRPNSAHSDNATKGEQGQGRKKLREKGAFRRKYFRNRKISFRAHGWHSRAEILREMGKQRNLKHATTPTGMAKEGRRHSSVF